MVCRGTRVLVLRVFKAALCYNLAESFGKRGEGHVGMAADSCKPIDRLLRHASQRVRPVLADVRTPVFWLIALGFGLFRMWSVVAGSPTVFVPLESTAFAAGTAASLVEDVVYALLLLVAGLVAYKRPRFSRRSMIGLGAAALCGATAVFGASSLTGSVEFWAAYVARVAFACAAGVVVVWAEQLCRFSPGGILACVAVAYASAYGGALVMAALPAVLCAVVQGALPVLSAGWRDARLPVWLGLRLDPSGKRAPVCGQILGHAFRMGCAAETASQNIDSERDTVSRSTLKRKPHPALMRGLRTKAEP